MNDTPSPAKVAAALTAIPEIAAMIEANLHNGTPKAGNGAHTKPASKPPAPVAVLSDIETSWTVLTTWAQDWQEFGDLHETIVDPTWQTVCDFLNKHWPNMAEQHPAANDFATEIAGSFGHDGPRCVLVRLSRHLSDNRAWLPLPGAPRCPIIDPDNGECGGKLMENASEGRAVCTGCGEQWLYADYERLANLLGVDPQPVPLSQAAAHAGIPIRTLRSWVERGLIVPVSEQPTKVMYAHVAAMHKRFADIAGVS